MVAGHIEGDEEIKSAMIREAREEAGIKILAQDLSVVGVMHLMTDREYVSFFLKASVWSGQVINAEPHKCDDLSWFNIGDLPDNTIPYIRRAMENYSAGVWFDSFGWQQNNGR